MTHFQELEPDNDGVMEMPSIYKHYRPIVERITPLTPSQNRKHVIHEAALDLPRSLSSVLHRRYEISNS